MLKRWKILAALLLALIFLFTVTTGCSNDAKKDETGMQTTTVKATETSKSAETTQEVKPTEPEFVKNDTTEKMVLFYPWANASTPEGMEEVKKALEAAMKDTVNVTLDWIIIPRENFEEKLNTMLASGEQMDGGLGDMDDLGAMGQKPGLVAPLNEILVKYGKHLKEKIPAEAWDAVIDYKGDITAIPGYNRYYWQGAVIRQDWLDKLGLQMPKTLSEIEAALEAFKKMDKNIIPASGDAWYLEPFLMSAVTGNVTPNFTWETLDESGENIIQTFTHPKFKSFLELYNRWLDNGWFNKDFLVTDGTKNDQMFVSGKVGILFTDPHSVERYEALMTEKDPKVKIAFMPVPSGPAGGPAFGENNGVGNGVWVKKNTKHPERVVQYLDWLIADKENYLLAKMGIDGKHWIKKGDKWVLPPDASGDPNKRGYFDVYAPLSFEFLEMQREDEHPVHKQISDHYKSLSVVKATLTGFKGNWDVIGNVNTIDIWGEMYNIAVKARPLSDFENLSKEFYETGGNNIYTPLTEQYKAWKAKAK